MEKKQPEDVLLDAHTERMSATALVTFNLKFVTSPNKWLGVTDSSGYKTICPTGKAGSANLHITTYCNVTHANISFLAFITERVTSNPSFIFCDCNHHVANTFGEKIISISTIS